LIVLLLVLSVHITPWLFAGGYKDFGGLKSATKFTKYENGKLHSVEEITGMTFVDRIEPRESGRP
jgi:hypothetical protein